MAVGESQLRSCVARGCAWRSVLVFAWYSLKAALKRDWKSEEEEVVGVWDMILRKSCMLVEREKGGCNDEAPGARPARCKRSQHRSRSGLVDW
jgi:hypothetical protein